MRVLIVEDDFVSRKILTTILEKFFECDTAEDGEAALNLFCSSLNSKNYYDLVCLDIMIPKKSGLEVLQQIRHLEAANLVPVDKWCKIIMTTALSDMNNIKSAFFNQCEAYLIKPISKEKLLTEIRNIGLEI